MDMNPGYLPVEEVMDSAFKGHKDASQESESTANTGKEVKTSTNQQFDLDNEDGEIDRKSAVKNISNQGKAAGRSTTKIIDQLSTLSSTNIDSIDLR